MKRPPALVARVRSHPNLRRGSICVHCAMPPAKKPDTLLQSAPNISLTALTQFRSHISQRSGQTPKALCKTLFMKTTRCRPSRLRELPRTPHHLCSQPPWRPFRRRCPTINPSCPRRLNVTAFCLRRSWKASFTLGTPMPVISRAGSSQARSQASSLRPRKMTKGPFGCAKAGF